MAKRKQGGVCKGTSKRVGRAWSMKGLNWSNLLASIKGTGGRKLRRPWGEVNSTVNKPRSGPREKRLGGGGPRKGIRSKGFFRRGWEI